MQENQRNPTRIVIGIGLVLLFAGLMRSGGYFFSGQNLSSEPTPTQETAYKQDEPVAAPANSQAGPANGQEQHLNIPGWRAVEIALALGMGMRSESMCEWEVWGRLEDEVYIWAVCEDSAGGTTASMPLVLYLNEAGEVVDTARPDDGNGFSNSVRRLFPPEVQERIFAHGFEAGTALQRIASRWQDRSIPPLVVQDGEALTWAGRAPVLGVTARSLGEVSELAQIGRGEIYDIFFSQDDRLLWLVTSLGVSVRELEYMAEIGFFEAQTAGYSVVLSPEGETLAWGEGKSVRLLSFPGGEEMGRFEIENGLVGGLHYSPQGDLLAVRVIPPGEEVYSHLVELRKVPEGQLISRWDLQGIDMAFAPDGQSLASWFPMTGLNLWQVPQGHLLSKIPSNFPTSAAFSHEGGYLAVLEMDTCRLWDLETETERFSLSLEEQKLLAMAFSPDGGRLATLSGEGRVELWASSNGELIQTIETGEKGLKYLAFSPDGETLALASSSEVFTWSLRVDQESGRLEGWAPPVSKVALSGDGSTLAVLYGLHDQYARLEVFDLPFMRLRFRSDEYPALSLDINRRGSMLALGLWNGAVQVLQAEDGSPLETLPLHSEQVQEVVFLDDFLLVSASMEEAVVSITGGVHKMDAQWIPLPGGWVTSLAEADLKFAAYSLMDGSVRVLSGIPWEVTHTFSTGDSGWAGTLAFSTDGTKLALNQGSQVRRWDLASGVSLPVLELEVNGNTIATSADGALLAVGMEDGTIDLFSWEEGILLRKIEGHTGGISSLKFTQDGRWLVSSSTDGTVKIWGIP